MHVVFGNETKSILGDKFTFLELDTFMEEGLLKPVTAFAVIGVDDINLTDIPTLDNFTRMHNAMMEEYRKKNWAYCDQAIEHLRGKWNKQLDSFYDIFAARLVELRNANLPDDWNGVVTKK